MEAFATVFWNINKIAPWYFSFNSTFWYTSHRYTEFLHQNAHLSLLQTLLYQIREKRYRLQHQILSLLYTSSQLTAKLPRTISHHRKYRYFCSPFIFQGIQPLFPITWFFAYATIKLIISFLPIFTHLFLVFHYSVIMLSAKIFAHIYYNKIYTILK